MTLATNDGDQPHVCTVFYVTDNAKTLYFKSYAIIIHANLLKTNPKIAIAIYDKDSSASGEKQGVQILGKAHKIMDNQEATKAAELYIKTFHAPREKFFPIEHLTADDAESSLYKVTVEKVKMLDSVNHIQPDKYLETS